MKKLLYSQPHSINFEATLVKLLAPKSLVLIKISNEKNIVGSHNKSSFILPNLNQSRVAPN